MSITEEQYQEWDTKLAESNFFGGDEPSSIDNEVYTKLDGQEPPSKYLNFWGWFLIVNIFAPPIRSAWPAPKQGGKKGKGGKKEKENKKEETEPKEEKDVDDEFDELFGETEEDEELKKQAAEKNKKAKEGAKKKEVIEKSIILFEVKPWEAGQDLDSLAQKIIGIEQDGLYWKTEYKEEPIGYGIYKLIVGCTIEDAKVSVDDLQEKITTDFENEVQSVDILSFNKV